MRDLPRWAFFRGQQLLQVIADNDLVVETDRDHDVGAHGADRANRHRVGKASIHQDVPVAAHRRKDAGHRNAGAHQFADSSTVE